MFRFYLRGYYPLGLCFPANSVNETFCNFSRINTALLPYNPQHLFCAQMHSTRLNLYQNYFYINLLMRKIGAGFGLFPFRSPLFREYFRPTPDLFYFPPGTEMFHFPGCASSTNFWTHLLLWYNYLSFHTEIQIWLTMNRLIRPLHDSQEPVKNFTKRVRASIRQSRFFT